MNIQVHIDALKYKLQQGSASRDRRYADSFLRHMLVAARKTLLKRRIDKGETFPDNFYRLTCVDFQDSTYHNCNCATGTCLFKTSIKSLPSILSSKGELILNVMNLNGDYVQQIDLATTKYRNKYSLNKDTSMTWHIQNKKIVLLNAEKIIKLLIRYIPLDFNEEEYNMEVNCNIVPGQPNSCFTSTEEVIFYDDDYTLYTMAYELIMGRMQDKLNNGTDDTIPTNLNTK